MMAALWTDLMSESGSSPTANITLSSLSHRDVKADVFLYIQNERVSAA